MSENNTKQVPGDIREAIEAGKRMSEPAHVAGESYSHHKDIVVTDLADRVRKEKRESLSGPTNASGMIICHRPESFSHAYSLYKEERTRVFANAEKRELVSVFDYISANNSARGWSQFRASIQFALSRKLKEWSACQQWTGQGAFAEFLEDHQEDVVDPVGQDLLSLATDLEASKKSNFHGKVILENGDRQLSFKEETTTTVDIPKNITLGIPLFEHGDPFRLKCRLRFRAGSSGVVFKILFTNLDDALEAEFERIVQEIEEKIGDDIIRGELPEKV